MVTNATLQIQSVIYNNQLPSIVKALDSIDNAIQVARRDSHGLIGSVKVKYGDASPIPVLSSSDVDKLAEQYKYAFSFSYHFFDENTGTSRGHNLLAENCSTEYILIINPDVILSPNYFTEALAPFANQELRVGLVEARQTPIEHPKEYDRATGETSWGSGAAALVPTTVFQEVGGFDETCFFLYCDDVDLSWRIRLTGRRIIYRPAAVVYHAKRLNSKGRCEPTEAEVYYSAEAALFLAYKWSNQKLLDEILSNFSENDDDVYQRAASSFLERLQAKNLPEALDKAHRIASFEGFNYEKRRFTV
ncbi:MAG: glycosyltransferase family 2 protein [Coriobacteriaceae bacterium]|nr:glycosyltransferase family 2 protein [Coriobacteriaceae bacterium]